MSPLTRVKTVVLYKKN